MKLNLKFWQPDPYVTPAPTATAPGLAKHVGRALAAVLGVYVVLVVAVGWWWSYEPDTFNPIAAAAEHAAEANVQPPPGNQV